MGKFKLFANKGVLRLFLSLLLVVVIMFVSNYIVYKNSISSIYNQVSENNKLVVTNVIRSFEESIKDVNGIIHAIQGSPYNPWRKVDEGAVDTHEAYLTWQDVQKLVTSRDYIEDVVVFHKNSDLAITATGTIALEELFRSKYYNSTYNAAHWKSLVSSTHQLRAYPAQWYTEPYAGGSLKKLMALMGSNRYSDKNVLVFINMEKLFRYINSTAMMPGSSLVVLDPERNVILNTEEDWDIVEVLKDLNSGADPTGTLKKKDYEYNLFKSEYSDFIYINKVPYRFADMRSVSDGNRLIIIIAILCSILLSAVLSSYLYKPIRFILKMVGGRVQDGADFHNIVTGIEKIQKENEVFKKEKSVIQAELNRSAFLDALEDVPRSQEAELRLQQFFTEFIKEKHFLMVAFHIKPNLETEQSPAYRIEDLVYTIKHGLRERLGGAQVFHISDMRFIVLLGIHQPSDREYVLKQLRGFVKQVHEEEWKGSSLLVIISRLYASKTANCPKANQDLLKGLDYRTINSDDPVIDVHSIRYTWKVYYPLEEIEKASNALVGGNEVECIRIIDDILQTNKDRNIHYHQLVPVVMTMFYYMIRHLEVIDNQPKEMIAMELNFKQKLEMAVSYDKIRETLIEAVKLIGEKSKTIPKSKLNPVSIAQYIESNYADNLHLDHMADHLETSPKYFSNYFKKHFGVNFVEYLNKVRLSHAKEYLKETDMSIAEIGEKTGYLNASTFTSTFKKYYGISPSEYRKQQHN